MLGSDIVYPFTRQENVINLQKTITEKLPIIQSTQPQSGFVPKQAWLDTSEEQPQPSNEFQLVENQEIETPVELPPNEEIVTPWELPH